MCLLFLYSSILFRAFIIKGHWICARLFLHLLIWWCGFCPWLYLCVVLCLLICICCTIFAPLEQNHIVPSCLYSKMFSPACPPLRSLLAKQTESDYTPLRGWSPQNCSSGEGHQSLPLSPSISNLRRGRNKRKSLSKGMQTWMTMKIYLQNNCCPCTMAHNCTPSYFGSRDQENQGSRPAQSKKTVGKTPSQPIAKYGGQCL
jgi:hypothetical protein